MRYTMDDVQPGTSCREVYSRAAGMVAVVGATAFAIARWWSPPLLHAPLRDVAVGCVLLFVGAVLLAIFGDQMALNYLNGLYDFGTGSETLDQVVVDALDPVEAAIRGGSSLLEVAELLRSGLRQMVVDGVEWRAPATTAKIRWWLKAMLAKRDSRTADAQLAVLWQEATRG